jgi:hypothetical protein
MLSAGGTVGLDRAVVVMTGPSVMQGSALLLLTRSPSHSQVAALEACTMRPFSSSSVSSLSSAPTMSWKLPAHACTTYHCGGPVCLEGTRSHSLQFVVEIIEG